MTGEKPRREKIKKRDEESKVGGERGSRMGRVCRCVGWVRKLVYGNRRFEARGHRHWKMNRGVPARPKDGENPIGSEHVRRLTPKAKCAVMSIAEGFL